MRISDWSSDVCSSDLPRRLRRRQPEGHRHDRCLYLSRPLRRNRPYRREGADPGAARRRLRRWRDHAAGGTLGAGKLALCQGRRVGPPRSTPRMAVRSQTQAKMRRFFRMLWTQIAYVAPAILIVVAGFVFAYQFVRPAPPDRVVMATGHKDGAYFAYGQAYAERFRSEEHTSELQSLMRISYAVFCLKKKKKNT